MNKLIGIVGYMGSGKSAVCDVLKNLGAHVVDADEVNRELASDPTCVVKVAELCPEAKVDNKIDHAILRAWAFGDPQHLHSLEKVVHPMIRDRILDIACGIPLTFVELSAYREGFLPLDEVWVVTADKPYRLMRVALRSPDWSMPEIEAAMDAQEEIRFPKGSPVIFNNGGRRALEEQVTKLYRERV